MQRMHNVCRKRGAASPPFQTRSSSISPPKSNPHLCLCLFMPNMHVVSERRRIDPVTTAWFVLPFSPYAGPGLRRILIVIAIIHRACLIHLSCSYASVGVHTRSDLAFSPFLCLCLWPCHCNPHPHGRDHGRDRLDLSAHFHQLSVPCSSPAHRRCHCRWKSSKNWNRNHQVRAACGRCSTLCCFSCPCPRCLPRPLPIVCLSVPVVLLVGGECRWAHLDRH